MRPHHLVLFAALAGMLASCQTMTPEERRAADQNKCAGYGFKQGTEGMARCLLDLDLDRSADQREWNARVNRDPLIMHPIIVERRVVVKKQ